MSNYQEKKIQDILKYKKTQFEETEETPISDMAEMLEFSEQKFKATIINMWGSNG